MATSVEVSYVTQRRAEHPPHERIERIGGIWNYKPWRMSEEYAIREVERTVYKQWDFCVSVADLTLPLIVAEHKGRAARDRGGARDKRLVAICWK
jgi:hypothetical protein